MSNRSQRGAARVSLVWMIVVVVFFFVAMAFGFISQQDLSAATDEAESARAQAKTAADQYDAEQRVSLEISEAFGYFPKDEAGARTNLEVAQTGLESFKGAFAATEMDATVKTFEDAVPVAVNLYKARGQEVDTLKTQLTTLQGEVDSLRAKIGEVTTEKDDQIRDLQGQLTDAENQARERQTDLEGRIASVTSDRNDTDSQLRSTRGDVEDLKRQGERERQAATTRHSQLTRLLQFTKEPEAPDGEVLAVSRELGLGWIDLGGRNRLNRGMVFRVVEGDPAALEPGVKGWARVTNVSEERAEVRFFDVTDQFDPIVSGDIVYNPLYDPVGERNAVLVGRFSGTYNEKELQLLLRDIGINVQDTLDLETAYLIVGSELYQDEEGEPLEEPIQPSELPVYKNAESLGVQIVSIRDLRHYFSK